MDRQDYGWAEYYRCAYEREKKNAALLAGKLFEAENRRSELSEKLHRITGNFLWKCFAPIRLAGRGGRKIRNRFSKKVPSPVDQVRDDKIYESYMKEFLSQQDPYTEWVRRKEPKYWGIAMGRCSVSDVEAATSCMIRAYQDLEGVRTLEQLWSGETKPEVIILAEQPDCLLEDAKRFALSAMREHPKAVLWYADEDYEDGKGKRRAPYFKHAWSPDSLLGFFYFGSYVGIRTEAADGITLSGSLDAKLNLYDLCLQLTYQTAVEDMDSLACRTPLILYTGLIEQVNVQKADTSVPFETTSSEDYRQYTNFWGYQEKYVQIKQKALKRRSLSSAAYPTFIRDVWSVMPVCDPWPLVSVVIPSKDNYDVLRTCVTSFLDKTDYPSVELIVVDNGSSPENQEKVKALLEEASGSPMVRATGYLYHEEAFNFSAMCNRGAAAASGELILLLNDDIEIIEKNWLKIMAGQSQVPGTGAVGAKLWYPACERIQHAGITNLAIGPSHKLITFPDDRMYYYGHGAVIMNMIGVTAACLLVSRKIYDELGGMNESMAVAYNDVEFCFRLCRNGYRNVQRNDAVLCHHESASRGKDELSDEKWARLLSEKERLYELYPERRADDPYYSCYLKQNSPEYVAGYEYHYEDRIYTVKQHSAEKYDNLRKHLCSALMLTMERVLFQRKYRREEPDILMAEGWCYMRGADNAAFERFLVLISERGEALEFPVNNRYRYDVCAILPHENNIGLAGFTCRITASDLPRGKYRTGLLCRHKDSGRRYFAEAELTVEV